MARRQRSGRGMHQPICHEALSGGGGHRRAARVRKLGRRGQPDGAGDGGDAARGARWRPRPGISVYLVATFGVATLLISLLGWMAAARAYGQDRSDAITGAISGLRASVAAVLNSDDVDGPDSGTCTNKLALVARVQVVPVSLGVLRADGSVVCA